jgi:hypothetical protein
MEDEVDDDMDKSSKKPARSVKIQATDQMNFTGFEGGALEENAPKAKDTHG